MSILAVELGVELCAVASRNLEGFSRVEVVHSSFEEWPLPDEPFDLMIVATAFHWLDPAIRLVKSAAALGPTGSLALVGTHHVAGGTPGFVEESQACHERWGEGDPGFRMPLPDEVAPDGELDGSPLFGEPATRRYVRDVVYTSEQYRELLNTYSPNRALDDESRTGLLDCLGNLIDSRFGGSIAKSYLWELTVAQVTDPGAAT